MRYLILSIITLLCIASCNKHNEESKTLKPLSSEEIFNKNQDAVVLIKHSFVYVIELLGEKYYFKEYNPETGEISEFISYEEAKANPNQSWGTGFFINQDGSVLTNRHLVDVKPNAEESKTIIIAIKNKLNAIHSAIFNEMRAIQEQIDENENLLYYTDYYSYEYDMIRDRIHNLRQQQQNLSNEADNLGRQINDFERNSKVSKTSFQFGIFFNNQKVDRNLNNYIKYKSVKISNQEEVDLALLQPVNPNDLANKLLTITDMSKIDSISIIPPKTTQKVIMIGYNKGDILANTTDGIKPQITEGNISQNTDNYKMLYTIPTLPGSSGSPIFDIYGRVVGVNFAGIANTQSFNFGIQPQQIKNFLQGTN